MKKILAGLVLAAAACLAACGGAGADQAKETTPGQTAGGDMEATCRDSFAKQRTCTDDFIPMLVDTRISLDLPAGIAAEGKKDGGRDALIKQAKEEWANDSAPEAVAKQCSGMSGNMSAEQKAEMMETHTKCLAIADCKAYVECVAPITKKMLSMRK